jgi:hypothetical protein
LIPGRQTFAKKKEFALAAPLPGKSLRAPPPSSKELLPLSGKAAVMKARETASGELDCHFASFAAPTRPITFLTALNKEDVKFAVDPGHMIRAELVIRRG